MATKSDIKIKTAIKKVLGVKPHINTIDVFAKNKFVEKIKPNSKKPRIYAGYEIISETEIEISYTFGDSEDSFKVEI